MTIAQEINFGYSPSSSADFEDGLNPLAFDDDFQNELGLEDDEEDEKYDQQNPQATKPKRSNNRKGPGNADKRATHNAVERARRESLNGRFSVSLTFLDLTHFGRPIFTHTSSIVSRSITLPRSSPNLYQR